jgi:hypothetical protein
MLIEEIIRESTEADVIAEIQTQLSRVMSKNMDEISTQQFLELIHDQGYSWVTMDQLIQLVDRSGYASSVNRDTIVPSNQLGDDVPQADPEDQGQSVDDMAAGAAMDGIEDEL